MDLHNGQVPAAEVWAVVLDAPSGSKDVEWFITAEAANDDYKDVVAYVRNKGGTAERWHVKLPGQRMEADAVTLWVEGLILGNAWPQPDYARRLDVFRK